MSGWRAYKDKWPNGRVFWTVENRKSREIRCGPNGGVTRYYDEETAKAESKRLRDQAVPMETTDD